MINNIIIITRIANCISFSISEPFVGATVPSIPRGTWILAGQLQRRYAVIGVEGVGYKSCAGHEVRGRGLFLFLHGRPQSRSVVRVMGPPVVPGGEQRLREACVSGRVFFMECVCYCGCGYVFIWDLCSQSVVIYIVIF